MPWTSSDGDDSVKRLTRSITVQSRNNLRYVATTFQLNNRRAAISRDAMMHPLHKLQGIQNLFAHLSSDRNVRDYAAQELRLGRLAMGKGYHPTGKELEARLYHSEKESDSLEKNGRKYNNTNPRPVLHGSSGISKLLLADRDDVDVSLGDGTTPLFKAVEKMKSAEVVSEG